MPPVSESAATTAAKVKFGMPRGRLFVGSYHRVPVKIAPNAGFSFDDLVFSVPAGAKGGLISPSRDRLFNPKRPHVMLLVGHRPGVYAVEARLASTSQLVGEGKFRVDTKWAKEEAGPTRWFTGIVGAYSAGSAWGGGRRRRRTSTRFRRPDAPDRDPARRASSQRFPTNATDLQGHSDRWLNEIVNGVTQNGTTRSSRLFYREVSYNNFDLSHRSSGRSSSPAHGTSTSTPTARRKARTSRPASPRATV